MYLFVYTVFYQIYCSINKFTCSKYISFLSILSSVCNRTRHQHILSLSSYFYTVELSYILKKQNHSTIRKYMYFYKGTIQDLSVDAKIVLD
jgi:hypothetical protein